MTASRIACLVMAAYFVFAALVQLNDPDPVRWVVLYAIAAGLSGWAAFRPLRPWLPAVYGAVAVAWALTLLPAAVEHSFSELFQSWQMMSAGMEEGREELGLLVVGGWMVFLALRARRARAPRAAAPPTEAEAKAPRSQRA